jgi:putative flippase GtrA
MKWWKRAFLVSVVWIALAVGGGAYLVALGGKTANPEQGRVIGETIGAACGVGLAFIWFATFVFRKKPPGTGDDS